MSTLELLNQTKIRENLNNTTKQYLSQIEILPEIDSTNSYLINKKNLPNGYVCLAEQQTAGRGRRNKNWYSPQGKNIYLSLCWHFAQAKQLTGLSLAMGVAVANALTQYGVPTLELKWPNDILYQHQKLCGILVEINKEANGHYRSIIGIGINVELPKTTTDISQPWIDLVTITQQPAARNLLVSQLLNELFSALSLFQSQGLAPFLARWQQWDMLRGQPISIHQQNESIEAIAVGIDAQGNLLVKINDIIKPINSGEVSVRLIGEKS